MSAPSNSYIKPSTWASLSSEQQNTLTEKAFPRINEYATSGQFEGHIQGYSELFRILQGELPRLDDSTLCDLTKAATDMAWDARCANLGH